MRENWGQSRFARSWRAHALKRTVVHPRKHSGDGRAAYAAAVPYAYGCKMTVLDAQGNPTYSGEVHDTGAGWDSKHHNVAPEDWIDIRLPGKTANNWGKQWRLVEICCEACQN
jgi:hypothetical protein